MKERRGLWAVIWVVMVWVGVAPALLGHPQTDESWPLYLAHRLLEGQRHGVDFFEINPPLFIWLALPSALIRRLTGIPEWQSWVTLILAAALGSLKLVSRQLADEPQSRRRALLLAAGFVVLVLPGSFYSEREHLSLILTLPFLFLAAGRAEGRTPYGREAVLAGVMGGMGFSIKPHFLIGWVFLELWLLAVTGRRSLRRLELWSLVGLGAAYLMAALFLAPDYFAMVRRLAPLYHTYLNNGIAGAIVLAGLPLLLLAVIAVAVRVAVRSTDRLLDVFGLAFMGFFTAALLQQKGLEYHYLTVWGFGFLMLVRAWQLRPPVLSWYPSGILVRVGALMMVAVVVTRTGSTVRELLQPEHPRYLVSPEYRELLQVTREMAPGEPIIVLSTNPNGGWPLTLDAGARWSSRYMHFWPMVAIHDRELWSRPARIVKAPPLEARSAIERRFMDEIMEDLTRHRPRLVLVLMPDVTQWGKGGSQRFDYLEYFGADPRFVEFMADYRVMRQIGTYQVWARAHSE